MLYTVKVCVPKFKIPISVGSRSSGSIESVDAFIKKVVALKVVTNLESIIKENVTIVEEEETRDHYVGASSTFIIDQKKFVDTLTAMVDNGEISHNAKHFILDNLSTHNYEYID